MTRPISGLAAYLNYEILLLTGTQLCSTLIISFRIQMFMILLLE